MKHPKYVKVMGTFFHRHVQLWLALPNVAAQWAHQPHRAKVSGVRRRCETSGARQSRVPRGSMGRAADGDCLECRVIGTTVCVGACCPHHHPTPGRDPADVPVAPTPARFPRVRLIAQPPSLPLAGSSGAIAYELWSGAPRPPAHRYVMAAFAGGFLAMGVYRAVM